MIATHTPQHDRSAAVLNKVRRQTDLNRLCEETVEGNIPNLLVIGAGIISVGITLDTASRGLKTVLIESKDLAFGTSCWSSKLTHGDLCHLASGNVGIVRCSAIEHGVLLDATAPYLVHSLLQVVSAMDKFVPLIRVLPCSGFLVDDSLRVIAGISAITLPLPRTVSSRYVNQLSPAAHKRDVKFGYVSYNGQLHDGARLVTTVARIAASRGVAILTRVRYENTFSMSVTLADGLAGEFFELPAHAVVNATSVQTAKLATNTKIRPSRGMHLILDAMKLGNPTGSLMIPVPDHTNRFCFVPSIEYNRIYTGLADEDVPGPILDAPGVPEGDAVFLPNIINQVLEAPLTRNDVIGAFAGLRLLTDADEAYIAGLPRRYASLEISNGLISIIGSKLIKYRFMAKQAVDKVAEKPDVSLAPCFTCTIPILGFKPETLDRTRTATAAGRIPMSLFSCYGAEFFEVIRSCPLDRPLDSITEGLDVTHAEFARHAIHEGVLSVDDILDHHTRLGLVMADCETALPAAKEALGLA